MVVKESIQGNQLKMNGNSEYQVFTFIESNGKGAEVYLVKNDWLKRYKEIMQDFDNQGVGKTNHDEKGELLTCRNFFRKEMRKSGKNIILINQGVNGEI